MLEGCFDFKIRKVIGSWSAKAGRSAVLVPLVGSLRESSSVRRIKDANQTLIRRRRRRIVELRAKGWTDPVTDRKDCAKVTRDFTYLLNCPPSSAQIDQKLHFCRRYQFCPFCWDRMRTQDLYRRLEWCWFGPEPPPDHHLLEFVGVRHDHVSEIDRYAKFPGYKSPYLELLLSGRFDPRDPAMSAIRTVEPHHRHASYVTISDRFVFAIPAGSRDFLVPDVPGHDIRIQRHEHITREVLAGVASRVAAYPMGMMVGAAETAVAILKARGDSSARWCHHYGGMRKGQEYLDALAKQQDQ